MVLATANGGAKMLSYSQYFLTIMIDLSTLILDPENPRDIKSAAFKKLMKSLTDSPELMEFNPIKIRSWEDPKVVAGNQRANALRLLGYKEVPDNWIQSMEILPDEKVKEFQIKDNVHAGTWSASKLSSWSQPQLKKWGVEVPGWKAPVKQDPPPSDKSTISITADITKEQSEYLEDLIKNKTAGSIGGSRGKLINAVQWCINYAMENA
jgi:hypothetical protein